MNKLMPGVADSRALGDTIRAMGRFYLLGLLLLIPHPGVAQQSLPPTIGITLIGGTDSCPVFVGYVSRDSPAERAGIKSGDVLLKVDGTAVRTAEDGASLLRTKGETPVKIE